MADTKSPDVKPPQQDKPCDKPPQNDEPCDKPAEKGLQKLKWQYLALISAGLYGVASLYFFWVLYFVYKGCSGLCRE
ncbi:hypothetical protein QR680_005276 [Steinernema hermaphroditum]|uniref:Transmembrane protein n=1 Tax=Steinernema hermaphroditum TaxID=289476 RepID=A0AA39LVC4_9BILA|nr:hypothetical protein QR680_005276 [Steinernema hermaphroditum]